MSSASGVGHDGASLRLFCIRGAKRPEVWKFIRLVARPDVVKHVQDLRNGDAMGAYCLRCKVEIRYEKFRNGAAQHMQRYHRDELERKATDSERSTAPTDESGKMRSASNEQQAYLVHLVAKWVASSMRPISIVEDPGLVAIFRFITREVCNINLSFPTRAQVRSEIVQLADRQRKKLMDFLRTDCDYFSLTTDIWTDRTMRSYISLTIHFVDTSFRMNNFVLEVEQFPGKHDAIAIANALAAAADRWQLDLTRCTRLLRDGASNAVSGADQLGVPSVSCTAHAFHLVVGGALIKKRGKKSKNPEIRQRQNVNGHRDADLVVYDQATSHTGTDDLLDQPSLLAFVDEVIGDLSIAQLHSEDDRYAENDAIIARLQEEAVVLVDTYISKSTRPSEAAALAFVRDTVSKFRNIAVYLHRSAKAKSTLDQIQRRKGKVTPLNTILDCPTRWNSTFDMLSRFIQLKIYIEDFFDFLYTTDGQKEFRDVSLQRPSAEDWCVLVSFTELLKPFEAATRFVSGEQYPTLCGLFPCLASIRDKLRRETILGLHASPPEYIIKLNCVRRTILTLFEARFEAITSELLWITYLNPLFAKVPVFGDDDEALAHSHLIDALVEMVEATPSTPEPRNVASSPDPTPQKADADLMSDIYFFMQPKENSESAIYQTKEGLRERLHAEFLMYIDAAVNSVDKKTDSLMWWRVNGGRFPNVRKLARKWLGCVATSVSSERAFSASGNIITAKRANLRPEFVRDLVFLAQNKHLN